MKGRIDHFVVFSTEPDGFRKDEVGAYTAKLHRYCDALWRENRRLRARNRRFRRERA